MITRTHVMIALLLLASCKGKDKNDTDLASLEDTSSRSNSSSQDDPPPPEEEDSESGGAGTAMALDEGKMGKKDSDRADGQYKMKSAAPSAPAAVMAEKEEADKKPDADQKNRAKTPEGPTRAWFPETFLFEPLIVTDANGTATVPVRVPDRLTTWRVLALGHSRSGAQGGAVTSFLGTLPTYIDPVVPPFMIVGDEIRLPIQIVNTTASPVTSALSIEVKNATVVGAGGPRTIPAQGSLLEYATIRTQRAGRVSLRTALGSTDAVERTIDVLPSGNPITITRTGTLAAPRSVTIEGPANSDPSTDRVRLLVYPGALSLLRSELGASLARGGVADTAYALLLAGKASTLLASLGDKPDPEALRTLTIVASQRAVRAARTLDVTNASLLTEAALAHSQNPVIARLGERAAAYLAKNQRPDGTFSGATGWTVQRMLIATADATRAINAATATATERQRAMGITMRASGAFERNFEHIQDGYTAASIVASGVTGALADKLRVKVTEAIKAADDGTKYLDVPAGIVRADGSVPSRAEATALAVLALTAATAKADPKAPLADLGATLLGSYSPMFGWGDGRANLACLQAVLELFKDPVPKNVTITLTMDGKPITSGVLDGEALRNVLVLEAPAPGLAGSHTWQLVAEPAVPGLGYSLTAHAWVPFQKETTKRGLELELPATIAGTVGKPTEITMTAIAPSGIEVHIQHALPAGVQVDRPSLEALVTANTIQRFQTADGKVDFFIAPLQPGQTFTAKYRVIPTLGGKLNTAASIIEAAGTTFYVPPSVWTIR